jgi:hypothetical protein
MFLLNSFACLYRCKYIDTALTNDNISEVNSSELVNDDLWDYSNVYYTSNFDNEEVNVDNTEYIGLGDFYMYNLMLLTILPRLSSLRTKVYVLIGHIIAVQMGLKLTDQLGCRYDQRIRPALPLPVIAVSFYAFLLKNYIEY